MSQKYIALAFLREIRSTVVELMEKEGGSMELERLEQLLTKYYNYKFKGIEVTETQVSEKPELGMHRDKLLRYKDGIVYLN